MGFPTQNDHFCGVLGVSPFKETPIWLNYTVSANLATLDQKRESFFNALAPPDITVARLCLDIYIYIHASS